ncbi:MAG: class I SAM-dependent methyltransferase [Candidatus Gracilibacteria bacterium]
MNEKNFLEELKNHGIKNDIPNISFTNAKFLRDLIKIKKVKNMLEIGTANGFSTINFALELKALGYGKITTIEFSPNSYGEALKNFKNAGVEDIINPLLGNALDIIPKLKEKYDFVFIDGMKKRSKDFLELVWNKTKKDGIIIIDDVIKFKHKMLSLYDYIEENNIKYNIIPIDEDDGIMMIIK